MKLLCAEEGKLSAKERWATHEPESIERRRDLPPELAEQKIWFLTRIPDESYTGGPGAPKQNSFQLEQGESS